MGAVTLYKAIAEKIVTQLFTDSEIVIKLKEHYPSITLEDVEEARSYLEIDPKEGIRDFDATDKKISKVIS